VPPSDPEDPRLEAGRALARRYFGDDVPERWAEVSPDLADITAVFAFADLWARPGLPLRDRSLIAVAVLTALRAHPQLEWHVRGALRVGLSAEEIREAIISVSGLAGFPASWAALEVAERVLAEPPG
jgi:4-carboxymuconolactone decarboxylase